MEGGEKEEEERKERGRGKERKRMKDKENELMVEQQRKDRRKEIQETGSEYGQRMKRSNVDRNERVIPLPQIAKMGRIIICLEKLYQFHLLIQLHTHTHTCNDISQSHCSIHRNDGIFTLPFLPLSKYLPPLLPPPAPLLFALFLVSLPSQLSPPPLLTLPPLFSLSLNLSLAIFHFHNSFSACE